MAETVGFLILNAVFEAGPIAGFTWSASTAAIVGNVAIATAAIGASYALSPDAPTSKASDGQIITRQALPTRRRYYGYVKIGGALVFSETKAGIRYQIYALNQGRLDHYLEHWLADVHVIVDGGGVVTESYSMGDNHFVTLAASLGTDDEAVVETVNAFFPDIWTVDHRLRGVAKVLLTTRQPGQEDFSKVYPGGQTPVHRSVVAASPVWDPRQPGQDRNTEAGWSFSENAVLNILDFHRDEDGMGLGSFDGIFFTDAAIAEDWIPAANICDELLSLKGGGTRMRYALGGGYDLPAPTKTTLSGMLAACDGWIYQRPDGAIGIKVGKVVAPTVTIGPDDILTYTGFRKGGAYTLTPVNKITGKYTERLLDFQEQDADPWLDQDSINRYGREELKDVQLQWVPFHPQARRLMKLAMCRARPEWSGTIVTRLSGIRAYSERYIHLVIPELMIDGTFEFTAPWSIDTASLTCTMSVASLPQEAFDFDPETEEGTPPAVPGSAGPDVIESPASVEADVEGSVIRLVWNPSGRDDTAAEAAYSVALADDWIAVDIGVSGLSATTPTLTAGTYDMRVRWVVGGLSSDWVIVDGIVVT
ncbi:hypothetical protein [Tardiphaga sp.]|uniref:hypothetical protein n=1 Tax=Tardiphaga sp. TaxID=1926292 RepID=UPI00261D570B|nr:hypothetical protein [Tardiphaga sp.]MDB5620763.1 hypothetical protein [Tardiphaga sp.]